MPEQKAKKPVETAPARGAKKKPQTDKERARKNDAGSKILAFVIVLLGFYAGLILLIAGFIFYSFNDTAKNTDIYSIRVVYDETTLHSITAANANNEYGLYVPFEYLTEIGAFGLAGDGDEVSLFIIGTDNRIQCTKNSSLIVINDNPVRISAPLLSRESDGEFLIPVVLLENYINGIDVRYDNDRMICYISTGSGKTDVALKMLLPEEMQKANFPESYKTYTPSTSSETSIDF